MSNRVAIKPVYNSKGWVLAECSVCGKANYVEPHGTTAACCMPDWTEHTSIPFRDRDDAGGLCVTLINGRVKHKEER